MLYRLRTMQGMIERYTTRVHGEVKLEGSNENTPQVCPNLS